MYKIEIFNTTICLGFCIYIHVIIFLNLSCCMADLLESSFVHLSYVFSYVYVNDSRMYNILRM